jgi:hypothetical protein
LFTTEAAAITVCRIGKELACHVKRGTRWFTTDRMTAHPSFSKVAISVPAVQSEKLYRMTFHVVIYDVLEHHIVS